MHVLHDHTNVICSIYACSIRTSVSQVVLSSGACSQDVTTISESLGLAPSNRQAFLEGKQEEKPQVPYWFTLPNPI